MVSVIIPAAGQGKRMASGVNKVFLELGGKPMLVRTMLAFSAVSEVDELVVAAAGNEVDFLRKVLDKVPGLKPFKVTAGGEERQFSVANALQAVSPEADIILIHDAARPLVSAATITAVIAEARQSGAAIAAVREKNTVKIVGEDGVVQATPDRATLWEVQTPQGFQRDILLRAYLQAMQEGFVGTDDASLVERIKVSVRVVESDYRNIKVTTPEDLLLMEAILRRDIAARAKQGVADVKQGVQEAVDTLAEKGEKLFRSPVADRVQEAMDTLAEKAEAVRKRLEDELKK